MYLLNNITLGNNKKTSAFLSGLNKNEMNGLSGEIYGKLVHFKAKASFSRVTNNQARLLSALKKRIDKAIKMGRVQDEKSKNGLIITRTCTPFDLYSFASRELISSDWEVLRNISSYSAYYVNSKTLQICSYCEGDIVYYQAKNEHMLDLETIHIHKWCNDYL
jgi:hypothetical protein